MKIQSVIVPKQVFSYKAAVQWLNTHDFKIGRVEETEDFWKFRQLYPPRSSEFFTKVLPNRVGLVMVEG